MKRRAGMLLSFVFTGVFAGVLTGASLLFVSDRSNARAGTTDGQQQAGDKHDGQRDFDFLVGAWKIHLKKLLRPLSGSNEWIEFDGTVVCRKVLDGRAEVEEFNVDSAAKNIHIHGLALRFYNPQARQWSIYWANAAKGSLDLPPMVGQFNGTRGEFYNQDVYEGRAIYTRFVWTNTTTDAPHFEQSYSADGGKTWESNWITEQVKQNP